MTIPPIPVRFSPRFKPRPWGGRRLADLLGKALPGDGPIGESWELSDLAGDESIVADGDLAGRSIGDLAVQWGKDLLGGAPLIDGRFPLLIKFLDARENLSVQVHPSPATTADKLAIKHESWVVLHADPGAAIYLGLRPGVTKRDVADAANSPRIVELLNGVQVRRGDSFYLPSGLPHALGAGVVVAEVQTPSDVTYRLYDWGRTGLDGKPRELHIEQALDNLLFDVPQEQVVQPRSHVAGPWATLTRLVRCDSFHIDRVRVGEGLQQTFPHAEPIVWIIVSGAGTLRRRQHVQHFVRGDVVLIPADSGEISFEASADCDVLEVKIPVSSPYEGVPHPPREQPSRGITPLTIRKPQG